MVTVSLEQVKLKNVKGGLHVTQVLFYNPLLFGLCKTPDRGTRQSIVKKAPIFAFWVPWVIEGVLNCQF